MKRIWVQELWRLIWSLIPALLLGSLFDQTAWLLFASLFIYVVYQFRQLRKIIKWLSKSLDAEIHVSGVWEELAYRIYQKRKRSRSRKKNLSKMLRRFQDSVSIMPDGAIVLDADNNILWLNPAATSILRLHTSDVGNNIANLVRTPVFSGFLREALSGESFEMLSPIDDSQTLELRIMPYGSGQRLLLVRNITQVQKLKTMRQEFVANVSHELRTPLTIIMGYLEALQEDDDLSAQEVKTQLAKMDGPARRMKQIVVDLLLLSRLDIEIAPSLDESGTLDMSALLAMIKKDGEQLSDGKHTVILDVESPVKLMGTESEVYSAISNLVSNAVRYSPDGGEIRIHSWTDKNGYFVSVSDQGVGISQEHIPRLTERFYRVDVGRSREIGGTGLGLAIVKQVLRRHDAALEVSSMLDKGTTFTCHFPLSRVITQSNVVTIAS